MITAADLAAFSATYEPAATLDFRGCDRREDRPVGAGPALLQTLAMLAGSTDELLDPSTGAGAHTGRSRRRSSRSPTGTPTTATTADVAARRAALRAYYAATRRALIGDAGVARVPARPRRRVARRPTAAAASTTPADGRRPPRGRRADEPTVLARDRRTRGDTCHIDVVDRWGNIVAATPSGGWLQSSPTIPELGFCLGTRLQMTWLERGTALVAARPAAAPAPR